MDWWFGLDLDPKKLSELVSALHDDPCNDDIYSDLDTDFDIAGSSAPSSNLSMVVGETSDDEDIVFPKFNLSDVPFSSCFCGLNHEPDCPFHQSNCPSVTLEDFFWTTESESISNLPEKNTDEEDAVQSLPLLMHRGKSISNFSEKDIHEENARPGSSLSMCRDDKLKFHNNKVMKRRSSRTNCPFKTKKPLPLASKSDGMISGKSISNLAEKDIDKKNNQPGSPLSMCRDEKLEPINNKGECQSSQSKCFSKTTKPLEDTLISNPNRKTAGKSISNLLEKDINEEGVQSSSPLSTCKGKSISNLLEKDINEEGVQSSSPLSTCIGKSISNLLEKDINEEGVQSSSPLSTCIGKSISNLLEKDINEERIQSSSRLSTCIGKSISNLLVKDINEEGVQSSSPLSTCIDEELECNSNKRKCQRSKRSYPCDMAKTSEDEDFYPDYHRRKCQGSQSNCPSKMIKPFDATTKLNLNKIVMSESLSNLPEKDIIKEDAVPDLALSKHGDEKLEPDNHKRKYQSSQSNHALKTKKPFHDMPASSSDVMLTSENISNLPEEGFNQEIDVPGSSLSRSGATRTPSSTGDQNTFLESEDSHGMTASMKLRIKSFMVPEFFVEIPETATISFLKKKVMEKATAIVGGAHVGVLQGEKIRDENETLSETDISNKNRLDVILEPIPSQAPHSCPLLLPCDISQPLTRYSPNPVVVHQVKGTSDTSPDPLLCNSGNKIQGDHDLVDTQTDMLIGKNTTSMEVISFPAISVEPLDVSPPVHQKSNSSKNAQRRKPEVFSKSEVEALVQAVEELGTGRWTKIREQAFGSASNRTHTDLKDKWRSLVNTAKRPVNKRRGVVLPQELLDRVLAVETHNSLQQATQH